MVALAGGLLVVGCGDDDDGRAGVPAGTGTVASSTPEPLDELSGVIDSGSTEMAIPSSRTVIAQADLKPDREDVAGAGGVAYVTRQGDTTQVVVQAEDVPATTGEVRYGAWLRNGRTTRFLGRARTPVTRSGELLGLFDLDRSVDGDDEVLVTRESTDTPDEPRDVVLRGDIKVLKPGDAQPAVGIVTSTVPEGGTQPETLLRAPLRRPGDKRLGQGLAAVTRQDGKLGLSLQANGIEPTTQDTAYGVWLRGDPGTRFLGFIQSPVKDGVLESISPLGVSIDGYDEILLTRETDPRPKRPENIVMQGKFQETGP